MEWRPAGGATSRCSRAPGERCSADAAAGKGSAAQGPRCRRTGGETRTGRRATSRPPPCTTDSKPAARRCSPHSITERTVPEPVRVLGSQPAGDVSHKPNSRLPLLSTRPAVTPATLKRAATNFAAW